MSRSMYVGTLNTILAVRFQLNTPSYISYVRTRIPQLQYSSELDEFPIRLGLKTLLIEQLV